MQTLLDKKTAEMGQHGVVPLLIKYSIPTTIGYAAFAFYNLVDRVFIGRVLGADALAGISLTFPLFMICVAIGMMIGIGGAAIASLRLGEGRPCEAERILGNVVALFLLCGIVLAILGEVALAPMLRLFGASPATLPHASTYMSILLLFLPVDFIAMGMNGMLRAEGSPHTSMTYLLLGAFLNIALDYLFIIELGTGIAGAALATGISKLVSASAIIWHFTRGKRRALTLRRANLRLRMSTVLSILRIGMSPFTMQFIQSAIIIVMNRVLLKQGGDLAVGAMGIVYAVLLVLIMPTMGLIHGSQPIIGFNYGANNHRRVKQVLLAALAYAFFISTIAVALVWWQASFTVALFAGNDPELMRVARHGLRILLVFMPLSAAQMVGAHYYQATGRPAFSIALHLLRQGLCFPLALAILPRYWGLAGAWAAIPVTDFVSAGITALFLKREVRRLEQCGKTVIHKPQ